MTPARSHQAQTLEKLTIVNQGLKYPRVSLIAPSRSVFLHLAAEVDLRPAFFPDSRRKKRLLAQCKAICKRMRTLDGVKDATVFTALLVPPRRGEFLKKRSGQVRIARYDLAALIECASDAAASVQEHPEFVALMQSVKANSSYVHFVRATNARRIGQSIIRALASFSSTIFSPTAWRAI